jgi:hypothetical protein
MPPADRNLGGFVSGMDARVSGSWRLGVTAGYSQSAISVDARHSALTWFIGHMAGEQLLELLRRRGLVVRHIHYRETSPAGPLCPAGPPHPLSPASDFLWPSKPNLQLVAPDVALIASPLDWWQKNWPYFGEISGGRDWDRTSDPCDVNAVLSR